MNQYEVQSHVGGFNLQPIQELELIVQVKPIDDMLLYFLCGVFFAFGVA